MYLSVNAKFTLVKYFAFFNFFTCRELIMLMLQHFIQWSGIDADLDVTRQLRCDAHLSVSLLIKVITPSFSSCPNSSLT